MAPQEVLDGQRLVGTRLAGLFPRRHMHRLRQPQHRQRGGHGARRGGCVLPGDEDGPAELRLGVDVGQQQRRLAGLDQHRRGEIDRHLRLLSLVGIDLRHHQQIDLEGTPLEGQDRAVLRLLPQQVGQSDMNPLALEGGADPRAGLDVQRGQHHRQLAVGRSGHRVLQQGRGHGVQHVELRAVRGRQTVRRAQPVGGASRRVQVQKNRSDLVHRRAPRVAGVGAAAATRRGRITRLLTTTVRSGRAHRLRQIKRRRAVPSLVRTRKPGRNRSQVAARQRSLRTPMSTPSSVATSIARARSQASSGSCQCSCRCSTDASASDASVPAAWRAARR